MTMRASAQDAPARRGSVAQRYRAFATDPWAPLRRAYHSLPIPHALRASLKSAAYARFPRLFASLPSYQIWDARRRALATLAAPARLSIPMPAGGPLPGRIELRSSASPEISVLIPVHGQCEYTLRCLASIARAAPRLRFEVVVIDDASPDDTPTRLAQCSGIRVLRATENLGFIRACNLGAREARGEFICFLNNDTEVAPGWLEELRASFGCFADAGLVGSRLVYPDGSLQEAGCVLWRDGSGWNLGRGLDPSDPCFSHARAVDYCSAASLMVRRDVFLEAGGFCEEFAPAYCEDAELALRLRARGLRCIFQPMSVVVHHEGVSCGVEPGGGHKRFQAANQRRLAQLWQADLASHLPAGTAPEQAVDRLTPARVLVIDEGTPLPDRDAGSVAAFNLMLLLRQAGLGVSFLPEADLLYLPAYTPALQRQGIETLYAPFVESVDAHLAQKGSRYDLVVLIRPDVADRHLSLIRRRCPRARVVYLSPDLHYLRLEREALVAGRDDGVAAAMRVRELALMCSVDAVIVHSESECRLLEPLVDGVPVHVFPWVVSVRGAGPAFAQRQGIVFLGGFSHAPNTDAVRHFVAAILPRIRERLPGVRLRVVGSDPPPDVLALACDGVEICGHVAELGPLLDAARVAVAPLRFGAGVKGKLVTTMSAGLPCVATPIAIEGMGLTDGVQVSVADEPQAFADAVVRLHEDAILWDGMSRAGIEFVRDAFGERAGERSIRAILGSVSIPLGDAPFAGPLLSPAGAATGGTVATAAPELVPACVVRAGDAAAGEDAKRRILESFGSQLAGDAIADVYTIDGPCGPCGRRVPLLVSGRGGDRLQEQGWRPNWRETLVCPLCGLNSRQRVMAGLLVQVMSNAGDAATVYLMEQRTPLFDWVCNRFGESRVSGSEFLGADHRPGTVVRGLRHEDACSLSYPDNSFAVVMSNEVFEHVADPGAAFRECARVLQPGGTLLFTVPFDPANSGSTVRASRENGVVRHHLPAVFHGNPLSASGSLVFTDFGWDLLEQLTTAGFALVQAELHAEPARDDLGAVHVVFRACTVARTHGPVALEANS